MKAEQIVFDFDSAPTAKSARRKKQVKRPPMAAKQKEPKKSAWQIALDEREARVEATMAALPDFRADLLVIARDCIVRFDAAARADDEAAAVEIEELADAIAYVWNGRTSFGCVDAFHEMHPLLAAPDGQEPLFGQPGRWIVEAAGCRHDFHTGGIFARKWSGHATMVVDPERPFVSETGFRSLCSSGELWGHLPDGTVLTPTECAQHILERMFKSENAKLRLPARNGGLHRDGKPVPHEPWKPRPDDLAWHPGGYLFELKAREAAGATP